MTHAGSNPALERFSLAAASRMTVMTGTTGPVHEPVTFSGLCPTGSRRKEILDQATNKFRVGRLFYQFDAPDPEFIGGLTRLRDSLAKPILGYDMVACLCCGSSSISI
jgi:hypothetical protein